MKILREWLERLLEAKGMPEEIRERSWIISKALMKFDGRSLGLDGVARERQTIEKARQAMDEIISSGLSFGHLSAKELADISWEPFAEAVWTAAVDGLQGLDSARQKADKFQKLSKWLLPLLDN